MNGLSDAKKNQSDGLEERVALHRNPPVGMPGQSRFGERGAGPMKRPDGQLFVGLVRCWRVDHAARILTVVRANRLRELDNVDRIVQNDDFWLRVFHWFHLLSLWNSFSGENVVCVRTTRGVELSSVAGFDSEAKEPGRRGPCSAPAFAYSSDW